MVRLRIMRLFYWIHSVIFIFVTVHLYLITRWERNYGLQAKVYQMQSDWICFQNQWVWLDSTKTFSSKQNSPPHFSLWLLETNFLFCSAGVHVKPVSFKISLFQNIFIGSCGWSDVQNTIRPYYTVVSVHTVVEMKSAQPHAAVMYNCNFCSLCN